MREPILTSELDSRFQLRKRREGCWGFWGDVVYHGQYQGNPLVFKKHSLYKVAQADAYPALEIRLQRPVPHTDTIQEMGLPRWLNNLEPSRAELLNLPDNLLKQWHLKNNRLAVIIVWYRQAPNWALIPDIVERLTTVAALLDSKYN